MTSLLSIPTRDAPSGPKQHTRHAVIADDPGRVAAFVIDLDALFEVRSYESALARAAARAVAARRGLDPLWTEVVALELANAGDAESAIAMLRVLSGEHDLRPEPGPALYGTLRLHRSARRILRTLRRRFKLALLSTRPAEEARAIAAALELERCFDVLVLSETVAGRGAEAASCATALALLREPADSCVLIGRPGSGALRAAHRSGMRTVALGSPAGCRGLAPALGPDHGDVQLESFDLVENLAAGAAPKYAERC